MHTGDAVSMLSFLPPPSILHLPAYVRSRFECLLLSVQGPCYVAPACIRFSTLTFSLYYLASRYHQRRTRLVILSADADCIADCLRYPLSPHNV